MDYYRGRLKEGESIWWMGDNEMKIRPWNTLSRKEQYRLMAQGFCLFPEILGNNHQRKFSRIALWLLKNGVVVPNLRDIYTAGGKKRNPFCNKPEHVSAIIARLEKSLPYIATALLTLDAEELRSAWPEEALPDSDERCRQWIRLVAKESGKPWLIPYLEKALGIEQSASS